MTETNSSDCLHAHRQARATPCCATPGTEHNFLFYAPNPRSWMFHVLQTTLGFSSGLYLGSGSLSLIKACSEILLGKHYFALKVLHYLQDSSALTQ